MILGSSRQLCVIWSVEGYQRLLSSRDSPWDHRYRLSNLYLVWTVNADRQCCWIEDLIMLAKSLQLRILGRCGGVLGDRYHRHGLRFMMEWNSFNGWQFISENAPFTRWWIVRDGNLGHWGRQMDACRSALRVLKEYTCGLNSTLILCYGLPGMKAEECSGSDVLLVMGCFEDPETSVVEWWTELKKLKRNVWGGRRRCRKMPRKR